MEERVTSRARPGCSAARARARRDRHSWAKRRSTRRCCHGIVLRLNGCTVDGGDNTPPLPLFGKRRTGFRRNASQARGAGCRTAPWKSLPLNLACANCANCANFFRGVHFGVLHWRSAESTVQTLRPGPMVLRTLRNPPTVRAARQPGLWGCQTPEGPLDGHTVAASRLDSFPFRSRAPFREGSYTSRPTRPGHWSHGHR
jgi:hypothetical protein